MAKKIDCTRSEKRPIASASASDSASGGDEPQRERAPARAHAVQRKADPICADAEEHHMRERHDAGVAEQEIIGGDEQDHHADLGGDIERLCAREQERRRDQREDDEDEENLQRAPARRIAREDVHRPLTG